jgi:hypothetical protein
MMSPKSSDGRNLWLFLACLLISSCTDPQGPGPPSPAGITVSLGTGTVAYYRWPDGPVLMICTDVQGSTNSGDSISGPPWIRKEQGAASSPDGRKVEWQLETTDGRNIQCRLDGKEYDLSKGALFLVKSKGGPTEVQQICRDLSAVAPDANSCMEFARKDPEVSTFLGPGAK